MKYIFVTGGVISSVGKGLTSASIGALLESRGYRVKLQKFDPYLNVDPGNMNPLQHGEVYVLKDGGETDLDLGHYERFTNTNLTRKNSLTSGQVYTTVLEKERKGAYAGVTVQVIPHVTDEIKARIKENSNDCDVLISEIGGTTGDIEGLPYLEAIREFALEQPFGSVIFIHVTLVPYISAMRELKTKPTQHSVAKLREIGITPNIIICRCEHPLNKELRKKISLFCNVPYEAVIEEKDVDHSIYELPLVLQRENLDPLICKLLQLEQRTSDMTKWQNVVRSIIAPSSSIRIGLVGKNVGINDAHKSLQEALFHACIANDTRLEVVKIDPEELETSGTKALQNIDAILAPGVSGIHEVEGKILAAQYARENQIPFLGICLGMQAVVIEYARNVLGLKSAHSVEFNPSTEYPVIIPLETALSADAQPSSHKQHRQTMHLGAHACKIKSGTKAYSIYAQDQISERHRNSYVFNGKYLDLFEKEGNLIVSGRSTDDSLVELVELKNHPFFMACQFQPEFQSKPHSPNPLFKEFVAAALAAKRS
jgi:CTP synthase